MKTFVKEKPFGKETLFKIMFKTEAVAQRCFVKKSFLEISQMFLKIPTFCIDI